MTESVGVPKSILDKLVEGVEVFTPIMSKADAMVFVSYDLVPKMEKPPIDYLEIRQSTFGRGVFATRDIDAGVIVTVYPTHVYGEPVDKDGNSACTGRCDYDERYGVTHYSSGCIYVGDKCVEDLFMCGHLLNDAYPTVEDFTDIKQRSDEEKGKAMMKYLIYQNAYANCTFHEYKMFMTIRTTRPIKAGEELFVPYNIQYWTHIEEEKIVPLLLKYIRKQPKAKADFMYKTIHTFLKTIK